MDLKDLADTYKCLMVCCVHPPTQQMRYEKAKKHKWYTLADTAESAHFANKSDIGLCIWQNRSVNESTYLNIDKIKNHELCGFPTGAEFRFDKNTERFILKRKGWDVLYPKEESEDGGDS